MKQLIHDLFSKFGLKLIKRQTMNGGSNFSISNFQYSIVTPSANYSPWFQDEEFAKIYSKAKHNTLVDIYRMYELWELTEQMIKLDNTASILEVGVWKGGTAAIIARKMAINALNVNFYIADTFSGVVKSSDKDLFYNDSEHNDTSLEIVENLLEGIYPYVKVLQGIFPEDTENLISKDEKFSLCHIDVDVYKSAKDILEWIWDRMIIGGVIVFDDYGFHSCTGVTSYVNDLKSMTDRLVIHNINGHALVVKLR